MGHYFKSPWKPSTNRCRSAWLHWYPRKDTRLRINLHMTKEFILFWSLDRYFCRVGQFFLKDMASWPHPRFFFPTLASIFFYNLFTNLRKKTVKSSLHKGRLRTESDNKKITDVIVTFYWSYSCIGKALQEDLTQRKTVSFAKIKNDSFPQLPEDVVSRVMIINIFMITVGPSWPGR